MKRISWIVAGLLLVTGICFWAERTLVVTTDYSAVCIRCLQQERGLEKSFLGFRYFHEEHLDSGPRSNLFISGEKLEPVDPHTYEEIFGQPCGHHFVRRSFGRYQNGLSSDGIYSNSGGIDARLALIDNLYLTFHRIPNRELARQSYALIDQYYPENPDPSADAPAMPVPLLADSMPNEPMSILLRGLPLIRTEKDWQAVLDAVKAHNGNIGLLNDRDTLIARLKDGDSAAREQALHSLAARTDPESWEAIAGVLGDPEMGGEAARLIIWGKRFECYERVMAIWERPYGQGGSSQDQDELARLAQSLTDADVKNLLKQQKPGVDRLCFQAIEANNRFALLEDVLAVLNQRPSPEAEHAILHLIAGPYPHLFRDGKTREPVASQWQALQDLYPNKDNPGGRIERTNTLLREAFKLGRSKDPGDWENWRVIFDRWWRARGAEAYSAAFAEAMYAIDPGKTEEYLTAQLKAADDSWPESPSYILAAMGDLASPGFLPAIEEFKKKSVGTKYGKSDYYRVYAEYAEHRCRQIQLWKLVQNPQVPGKFVILRPDGSTIEADQPTPN